MKSKKQISHTHDLVHGHDYEIELTELVLSKKFNYKYYIDNNQDVDFREIEPLYHYVHYGKKEGRFAISPQEMSEVEKFAYSLKIFDLVDVEFYTNMYPEVLNENFNPYLHYAQYGIHENRLPLPKVIYLEKWGQIEYVRHTFKFDKIYYLKKYPDVDKAGLDAFLHFVFCGQHENRESCAKSNQEIEINNSNQNTAAQCEEASPVQVQNNTYSSKIIAFYLPQFHPIPENDKWWGEGFTEWTNVVKAQPQFSGHYQPHFPSIMGFYDLRLMETIKKQADLARKFGIYGFSFYYYNFSGKRLLEKPLNIFLMHKNINIKFCICWANENWTRQWDGKDKEILIKQEYHADDDMMTIMDLEQYITDDRYIRVDGKPLLIIYNIAEMQNPQSTFQTWREYWFSKHQTDLHIAVVWREGQCEFNTANVNSYIQFPPISYPLPPLEQEGFHTTGFKGQLYSYFETYKRYAETDDRALPIFKTVFPSWDNTPRRGKSSSVFVDSHPALYSRWLKDSLTQNASNNGEFVFINAWNEWAEGAHLEPCRKYGFSYLNATSRALRSSSSILQQASIAVLVHVFYLDLLDELIEYIKNIPYSICLYVSTCSEYLETVRNAFKGIYDWNCTVRAVENIGFDISPMTCVYFKEIFKHNYVIKIHTKKSLHNSGLRGWRKHCLDLLLGTPSRIDDILYFMSENTSCGIVYPETYPTVKDYILKTGNNMEQIIPYWAKHGYSIINHAALPFPAGSFFVFRPNALKPLFDLEIQLKEYISAQNCHPVTNQPIDLTLAHIIERSFCMVASIAGYQCYQVSTSGNITKDNIYVTS